MRGSFLSPALTVERSLWTEFTQIASSTLLPAHWGPRAFGFASVLCSFMIADVGRDERAFMFDSLNFAPLMPRELESE